MALKEDQLEEFFTSLHIRVKREWLRAAIAFLKAHKQKNKEANLCHALLEQFLHSNLEQSYEPFAKVPVVAVKSVITKQMIFQLVSIANVALSCYEQYSEYTGKTDDLSCSYGDNEECDTLLQPSLTVMGRGKSAYLKFKLTDGQNTLHAIQYGGDFLSRDTPPGVKILGGDVEQNSDEQLPFFMRRLGLSNKNIVCDNVSEQLHVLKENELDGEARKPSRSCINATNLSTISPFLVRVPRVPNRFLHSHEEKSKKASFSNNIKGELPTVNRTAIVPPLLKSASVLVDEGGDGISNQSDPFEASRSNQPVLPSIKLECRRADAVVSSTTLKEDLNIPLGEAKLVIHEVKPRRERRMRRTSSSTNNRSIADYFNVSRVKTENMGLRTPTQECATPTWLLSRKSWVPGRASGCQAEGCPRQSMYVTTNSHLLLPMKNEELQIRGNITIPSSLRPIKTRETENAFFTQRNDSQLDNQSICCGTAATVVSSTTVVPYKRPRRNVENASTAGAITIGWPTARNDSDCDASLNVQPSIMSKFMDLKIKSLTEIQATRRFWMLPKIVNIMGVCNINGELTAKHGSWLLNVDICDESMDFANCAVSSRLLESLLGFSVKDCEKLSREKNMAELSRCKERAVEVMKSFQRLDLILSLEIHSHKEQTPIVVKVLSLYEALRTF